MVIYRCQDSLEGIFSGIYRVYEDRIPRLEAMLSLDEEPMLFARDVEVEPDQAKTTKVAHRILKQFGQEDYETLCYALSADASEKAQAVYWTVAKGLDNQVGYGHLLDDLADDLVNQCFKLARTASREQCHLRGFIRFEELENGILYSKIEPKNNLLTFLMPHFADRFPMENFTIFDAGRGIFGIHPAGKQWYLMQGEEPETRNSGEEEYFQSLFRQFCKSIAIKERKNLELQRNLLPLRFREYMTEFQNK